MRWHQRWTHRIELFDPMRFCPVSMPKYSKNKEKLVVEYLFNHQRKRFSFYTVFTCLSCICNIGLALIMSTCIDLAMQQKINSFIHYGISFMVFILTYMVIDYLTQKLRCRIIQYAQTSLRSETLSNILSLDLDSFHKKTQESGYLYCQMMWKLLDNPILVLFLTSFRK